MFKRLSKILRVPLPRLTKALEEGKDDPLTPILVKTAVHEDQVMYLEEHRDEFPGVEIVGTYLRDYEYRALAAQVLGYVGEISPEELERARGRTATAAGDKIGKTGVEAAFDTLPARPRRRGAAPRRLARAAAGRLRAAPAGPARATRPADARHRPAARGRAGAPRRDRARVAQDEVERERRRDRRARPPRRRRARDGVEPDLQAVRLRRPRRPEEARAAHWSTGSRSSATTPASTARSPASIRPARRSSRSTALAAISDGLLSPYEYIQCTPYAEYGLDKHRFENWNPYTNMRDDADDGARAVVRHVLLRRRQPLLHPRRDAARLLDADAELGAEVRLRRSGRGSTSAARTTGLLPTPAWRQGDLHRGSTAPGTRAT